MCVDVQDYGLVAEVTYKIVTPRAVTDLFFNTIFRIEDGTFENNAELSAFEKFKLRNS